MILNEGWWMVRVLQVALDLHYCRLLVTGWIKFMKRTPAMFLCFISCVSRVQWAVAVNTEMRLLSVLFYWFSSDQCESEEIRSFLSSATAHTLYSTDWWSYFCSWQDYITCSREKVNTSTPAEMIFPTTTFFYVINQSKYRLYSDYGLVFVETMFMGSLWSDFSEETWSTSWWETDCLQCLINKKLFNFLLLTF